jgi:hypothetical protein
MLDFAGLASAVAGFVSAGAGSFGAGSSCAATGITNAMPQSRATHDVLTRMLTFLMGSVTPACRSRRMRPVY